MKKLIILVFSSLLFCFNLYSQSIKGYGLGDRFIEMDNHIKSTVGGLEGTIVINTNDYNLICSMGFVAKNVSQSTFDEFKENVEQHYQVKLEKELTDWMASKEGIGYSLSLEENNLVFVMIHNFLSDLHAEKQKRQNSKDF